MVMWIWWVSVIMLAAFVVGLGGIGLSYFNYRQREKQKIGWQTFATNNHLKLDARLFATGGALVEGVYQGHHVVLKIVNSSHEGGTCTRLALHPNTTDQRCHQLAASPLAPEVAEALLTPLDAFCRPLPLPGPFGAEADGQLFYEVSGVVREPERLQTALDLLYEAAESYVQMMALGSEMVTALHAIATNAGHPVRQAIAAQWLREIAQSTTDRFGIHPEGFWCASCLVRFSVHRVRLTLYRRISYYGCRACGQSRRFFIETQPVVAVLNRHETASQTRQADRLYVNWCVQQALFDFDTVAIQQARDEEVERFVVQVGNDTDPVRRRRYKDIPCVVSAACELSENTVRLLKRTFRQVQVETLPDASIPPA